MLSFLLATPQDIETFKIELEIEIPIIITITEPRALS